MFGLRRAGDRLAALERAVRKLEQAERERGAAIDRQLSQLAEHAAAQPTAKDLRELRQAVRSLASPDDRQTLGDLARLAASGKPIVVGPWTGELGFELLYWIPFVAWVRSQWSVAAERLTVISRGGVGSWYGVPDDGYADIFSFVAPERFRDAVAEAKRKQRHRTRFDQDIIDTVKQARGLDDAEWLHPGVMYRLFAPFWSDEAGYARIEQFTRYRLLDGEGPAGDGTRPLPDGYIAVRFYFSECFPDTAGNRAFVRNVVLSLAARQPVVLLNPGFSVDEHEDWTAEAAGHVHTLGDRLPAAENLAIQARVIRGARAFVGTYGGYSYLAPMCRVPALAFHSRPVFKRHHLYAAERAFAQIGAAPLTVVDVGSAPLAQAALGALAGVLS